MGRKNTSTSINCYAKMHDGNLFFKHKYGTYDIVSKIKTMCTFEEFERFYNNDLLDGNDLLGDYLTELLDRHNAKAEKVSVGIGYSHDYVRKIAVGERKNPRRDVLLAICTYIHATVEETQLLLQYAGQQPLYVRRKRDAIIWFALLKEQDQKRNLEEDFEELNNYLLSCGYAALWKG